MRRVLGKERPDTLLSTSNLASAYYGLGRWKEAEELGYGGEAEGSRRGTLTSMGNLAITYDQQSQCKEAEELQLRVLQVRRRVQSGT